MINEGRRLFFNETFDGNGRTCGTCHAEDNNFTIDPKSISKLPADDPLFVAERKGKNPLKKDFEKPELMHKLGLILENTNGFDNGFTMRAVSHMLAMRTSITRPTDNANDGTSNPPDERTGWGGDGSPTDLDASPPMRGTLRHFTNGGITQHLTKTLNREAGVDFRLATEAELDAIEAFMLTLGRQEEYDDFNLIALSDERADMGRRNYMGEDVSGPLTCNACHFNGGANTDPNFDFASTGVSPAAFESTNRSFAPRVEELINQPGDVLFGGELPFDDGFGAGTNLFNVPSVIEAADTGPFFHSNQIDTVEAMISFYATKRHLRNGDVLPPIVELNGSQVANVGAFLRVVNADENARSAMDLVSRAQDLSNKADRNINLYLAGTEIDDALEVLNGGNLHFADAVPMFEDAKALIGKGKMREALKVLDNVRDVMIDRSGV
jgi:cytochrome c peroxidase